MNMKRMRGRSHRSSGGPNPASGGGGSPRHLNGNIPLNRNHVFDSSGPDVRVRGTAQQLFEKYQQLGRDATSIGDRVAAEGFYQHAEHYFRILSVMNQAVQQNPQSPQHAQGGQHNAQGNAQNGQYQRRQDQNTAEQGGNDGAGEHYEEATVERSALGQPAGLGDQPTFELREIPIAAEPPVEV